MKKILITVIMLIGLICNAQKKISPQREIDLLLKISNYQDQLMKSQDQVIDYAIRIRELNLEKKEIKFQYNQLLGILMDLKRENDSIKKIQINNKNE